MVNLFAKIGCVLILSGLFSACNTDLATVEPDKRNIVPSEDSLAINDVIKQWREGYEIEDIETYMSVYWSEGFRYVGDLGTEGDKTDDIEFDDLREERDAANKVFSQFQDIIVISKNKETLSSPVGSVS